MGWRLLNWFMSFLFLVVVSFGNTSLAQLENKNSPKAKNSTLETLTLIEDVKGTEKKGVEQDKDVEGKKSDEKIKPLKQDDVVDEEKKVDVEPVVPAVRSISDLKSSELLPPSTRAWISFPDLAKFEAQFDKTQLGQLAADPEVKPFFEDTKKQVQDFLDEKNLRIGLRMEKVMDIRSGEVCIAGVLQDLEGGQPARGSHGLVLLVDVTGNEVKADQALADINAEMVKTNGGNLERLEVSGVTVTKLSAQNPKRIRQMRNVFQAIHNGWLLISDNEEIFRDILRRLVAPEKINKSATLSMFPTFTTVMKETELFGVEAELSWYVDPFGYLQLAQKLYDEEQEVREHHDDWPRVLRDVGFDAVKGLGGNMGIAISVKDQDLESLNRMFIFAPRDGQNEKHQRFFDLFDFTGRIPGATDPHEIISDDSAGFFGGSWQFTKLLGSVGFIYDSVTKEEGDFKRLLHDFKNEPEFQVDVPRLIGTMGDQLFVFSTIENPISATSERAAVGIPLSKDADGKYIMSSLKRMAKGSVEINLGGKMVIEVDTTIEPDLGDDLDLPPGFDEGFDDDLDDDKKAEKRFSLFEKRYMAIHNGILIIANDKQYMRQLLGALPVAKMNEAEDYVKVKNALEQLTDVEKVCFRRFVRLDRTLEVNYHIIRQGEMVGSATMAGRLLNKFHESSGRNSGEARKQKLDGSMLPEDYQKKIAPSLGPSGWVTENEEDGWRITGCLLKK